MLLMTKKQLRQNAFSLIEIVIALGILSVSITALIGALSIGMTTNRESIEELEATHMIQSFIAERRSEPLLDTTNFLLPPLNQATTCNSTNPIMLDNMGRVLAPGTPAKFGMVFRITPNTSTNGTTIFTNSVDVYCAVYWPGKLSATKAQGKVEMVTKIVLPASP
jgi:uncharacterized protein (TIGR02598 family)